MMSAVSNALPRTSVVPASSELDTVCSGSNPKSTWGGGQAEDGRSRCLWWSMQLATEQSGTRRLAT